jgi:hypothetical protein
MLATLEIAVKEGKKTQAKTARENLEADFAELEESEGFAFDIMD